MLGVGHSLGGYLTLLAALRRPELFRAVMLLDAPILGAFQGSAVQLVKHIGLIDRVTPAGSTKNRRREWPSLEEALAHFRRKRLFRNFDPDCLWDYAHFGTRLSAARGGAVVRPAVEYRIYRTIPHDLAGSARRLAAPGGFIGGNANPLCWRALALRHPAPPALRGVDGGHSVPVRAPAARCAGDPASWRQHLSGI